LALAAALLQNLLFDHLIGDSEEYLFVHGRPTDPVALKNVQSPHSSRLEQFLLAIAFGHAHMARASMNW